MDFFAAFSTLLIYIALLIDFGMTKKLKVTTESGSHILVKDTIQSLLDPSATSYLFITKNKNIKKSAVWKSDW